MKQRLHIDCVCPGCNSVFNMFTGQTHNLSMDGEIVRLLFCGKCEIDFKKVLERIKNKEINLTQMAESELEIENAPL